MALVKWYFPYSIIPRRRLILTSFALLISGMILGSSVSFFLGVQFAANTYFSAEGDVFLISNPEASTPFTSQVPTAFIPALMRINGVLDISPETLTPAMYYEDNLFVRGIIYQNFTKFQTLNFLEGSFQGNVNLFSAVIGKNLANKYHWHLGDVITLTSAINSILIDIIITGIFDSKDLLNDEVLVTLPLGQKFGNQGENYVTHIRVKYNPDLVNKQEIINILDKPVQVDLLFNPRNGTNVNDLFNYEIKDDLTQNKVSYQNDARFGKTYTEYLYLGSFTLTTEFLSIKYSETIEFSIEKIQDLDLSFNIGPQAFNVTLNFILPQGQVTNEVQYQIYKENNLIETRTHISTNVTTQLQSGEYVIYAQYMTLEKSLIFTVNKPLTLTINFEDTQTYAIIKSPNNNTIYSTNEIPLLIKTNAINLEYALDNDSFKSYDTQVTLFASNGNHTLSIRYTSNNEIIEKHIFFKVNQSLPDFLKPITKEIVLEPDQSFTFQLTKPVKRIELNLNNQTSVEYYQQQITTQILEKKGIYDGSISITFWNDTTSTFSLTIIITEERIGIMGASSIIYATKNSTLTLFQWKENMTVTLNNTIIPVDSRTNQLIIPEITYGVYNLRIWLENETIKQYTLIVNDSSSLFFDQINGITVRNETSFTSSNGWFSIQKKEYNQPVTLYLINNTKRIRLHDLFSMLLPNGTHTFLFELVFPTNSRIQKWISFISKNTSIETPLIPDLTLQIKSFPKITQFNISSKYSLQIYLLSQEQDSKINMTSAINQVLIPGKYVIYFKDGSLNRELVTFIIPNVTAKYTQANSSESIFIKYQEKWFYFSENNVKMSEEQVIFLPEQGEFLVISTKHIQFNGTFPLASNNGTFNFKIYNDFYRALIYVNDTLSLEIPSTTHQFQLKDLPPGNATLIIEFFDLTGRSVNYTYTLYPWSQNQVLELSIINVVNNQPIENAFVQVYSLDLKEIVKEFFTQDNLSTAISLLIGNYRISVAWNNELKIITLFLNSNQSLNVYLGKIDLRIMVYYPNDQLQGFIGQITITQAFTSRVVFSGANNPDLVIYLDAGFYIVTVRYKEASTQKLIELRVSTLLTVTLPLQLSNVTLTLVFDETAQDQEYKVIFFNTVLKQNYYPTLIQNNNFIFFNIPSGNYRVQIIGSNYYEEFEEDVFYDELHIQYSIKTTKHENPTIDISKLPRDYAFNIVDASKYADQYLSGPLQIAQTALLAQLLLIIIILIANNIGIMIGFVRESIEEILIVLQLGGSKFQAFMSTSRSLFGLSIVFGGLGSYLGYGLISIIVYQAKLTLVGHTFYPMFTWYVIVINSVLLFVLTVISLVISFVLETRNTDPWQLMQS